MKAVSTKGHASGLVVVSIVDPVAVKRDKSTPDSNTVFGLLLLIQVCSTVSG